MNLHPQSPRPDQETAPTASVLGERILQRIKSENIAPTPRWHFIFSECVMWALWLSSILIGAAAVAVMLYVAIFASFSLYEATHDSVTTFILEVVPVMWVGTFVVMALLAYFNLRHTRRGYRYPVWLLMVSSVVLSVFGGIALHTIGAGQTIDRMVHLTMPMYPSYEERERRWWNRPQQGLLVGRVATDTVALATSSVPIIDQFDRPWTVITDELPAPEITRLVSGDWVKIVGVMSSTTLDQFFGCGVLPWMAGKSMPMREVRQEKVEFMEKIDGYKQKIALHLRDDSRAVPVTGTSTPTSTPPMGPCATMPLLKKMP